MILNIKDYLKKDYVQKTIKERYAYIISVYDDFIINYCSNKEIYIDKVILQQVILSWQIDEQRHIDFHNIKIAKHYKQAAYFVYWFLRFKPIHIKLNDVRSNFCVINEYFAFYIALNIMQIPLNSINKAEIDNLIYSLHYRNMPPESLFIIFELMKNNSRK